MFGVPGIAFSQIDRGWNRIDDAAKAAQDLMSINFCTSAEKEKITDALSGQFEVLSVNAGPVVMQHIKAGKLRALAVGAPSRLDAMPQVPTLAELGFAQANLNSLFGVFAPAGVPQPILDRLNTEINKVLALPDFRARLIASDNVPTGGSAADFSRQIASEFESNARIIKTAGIKAE